MDKIEQIFTDQIDDPAVAMRGELNRDELFELADNIKQNGLINPITIRPKNGRYEVVAGHRRLSACKIAGIIKIPCVIRELDDQKTFEVMAAENLERSDVNPVEEAIFLHNYMERTGKSVAETAKAIKRSIPYVQSRLVIGQMPEYMQEYLKTGQLKIGVAVTLMEITESDVLRMWTEMAVRDGVSVSQAEFWVHGWRVSQLPNGVKLETPPGGFTPEAPAPLLFECAIDGKRYEPADMRTVMIYKNNLEIFYAVAQKLREPELTPSPQGGEGEGGEVGERGAPAVAG